MKILLSLSIAFLSFSSFAQAIEEEQVPDPFRAKLNVLYPEAKKMEWFKKPDGRYEVEFRLNKLKSTLVFTKEAEVLKYENVIESQDVPAAVLKSYSAKYKGFMLKQAEKVFMDGKTYYELGVEKEDDVYDLLYTDEGVLMEIEKKAGK